MLLDEIHHVRRSELGNQRNGGPSFKGNQGEGAEAGGKGNRSSPTQNVTGFHLVDVFVHNFGFYHSWSDKVDAALGHAGGS